MAIASGMKDITQDIVSSYEARIAEVGKLKNEAKKMLDFSQASHREMSTEMKKGLTQGVAVLKSEVTGMLGDFLKSRKLANAQLRRELADYDRGIKSQVAATRQEIRTDLRGASAAWQELVSTMQTRVGLKVVPEVKKTAGEISDMEAKLLAAIREHPEGTTLTAVAESLDIAPIVLSRPAKRLVDGGKVRKEDKLYFPAGTERG